MCFCGEQRLWISYLISEARAEKLPLQDQCEEVRVYFAKELFLPTYWRGNEHKIKIDFAEVKSFL